MRYNLSTALGRWREARQTAAGAAQTADGANDGAERHLAGCPGASGPPSCRQGEDDGAAVTGTVGEQGPATDTGDLSGGTPADGGANRAAADGDGLMRSSIDPT